MTGNYSWKAFYTELADKLLEFKNNRQQLVDDLYYIFDQVGMKVPKLESDGQKPEVMDPFTIYSLFNRGITDLNRAKIAMNMKELWNMNAEAPTEFDGIPVMNNMRANFFTFKENRTEGDVDRLWNVFTIALAYAEDTSTANRAAFVAAYDSVIGQICIKWNITVGLYWIRPDFYLNLDTAIRTFLYTGNALGEDIASKVREMKTVPKGNAYLELRDAVSASFEENAAFTSFADLSYQAFVAIQEANKKEKVNREKKSTSGGTGGEEVRGIHYWVYTPGSGAFLWDKCLDNNCMMIGWGDLGDISHIKEHSHVVELMKKAYDEDTFYKDNAHTLWTFVNEMEVGDIVFCRRGLKEFIGYGKVTSAYRYDTSIIDSEYANLRSVEWISSEEFEYPKGKAGMKILADITNDNELVSMIMTQFNPDGIEPEIIDTKKEEKPYSKSDFLNEVYMDESDYDELVELVKRKKNVILQGPPGVGKTYSAKRLAFSMMGNKDPDHVMMVQFHQSYSYEDFIMGYRPDGTGFKLEEGPFYTFCRKAKDDPDSMYFFIIDEINRGNISKIFGELFMLIEADKRGKTSLRLPYKDVLFSVPENIYIIGMMNTADRSLALIDYALRRRFSFWEMKPAFSSQGFLEYVTSANNDNLGNVVSTLCKLNSEIISDDTLGRGFAIGHSYLVDEGRRDEGKLTDSWLRSVIRYDIVPLLEEYWYDDPQKVEDWKKRLLDSIK